MDTENLEILHRDVQNLLYRNNVETRIIEDKKSSCIQRRKGEPSRQGCARDGKYSKGDCGLHVLEYECGFPDRGSLDFFHKDEPLGPNHYVFNLNVGQLRDYNVEIDAQEWV